MSTIHNNIYSNFLCLPSSNQAQHTRMLTSLPNSSDPQNRFMVEVTQPPFSPTVIPSGIIHTVFPHPPYAGIPPLIFSGHSSTLSSNTTLGRRWTHEQTSSVSTQLERATAPDEDLYAGMPPLIFSGHPSTLSSNTTPGRRWTLEEDAFATALYYQCKHQQRLGESFNMRTFATKELKKIGRSYRAYQARIRKHLHLFGHRIQQENASLAQPHKPDPTSNELIKCLYKFSQNTCGRELDPNLLQQFIEKKMSEQNLNYVYYLNQVSVLKMSGELSE